MAGSPLTTQTAVVAKLLRPLTPDELVSIDYLIDEASAQLRFKRSTIDAEIAAGSIEEKMVAGVLAGVLKRVLINPRGLWSTSETEGDYSISETYPGSRAGGAAADSPGDLEVTAADLAKLSNSAGRPRQIRTSPLPYPNVVGPCR